MSFLQNLDENILVTLLGMGVVFAVLIILSIVILLFKFVFIREDKPQNDTYDDKNVIENTQKTVLTYPQQKGPDEELVAVIAAALSAYSEQGFKLRIRSIKRVNAGPAWARAGRNEIIESRL